ncbi:MAG: hypothetical protein R3C99_26175 [Pirellulaceae bacterium]|nr:hypothetical protein [Planctomycetales bacterium]
MVATSSRDVFINCPFDEDYYPLFQALYFTIASCGFRVRCALEIDDGSEVRFEKILRIIGQSRYGIHDISRTELDPTHELPRFNMPLELGLFLAAKRFGDAHQKKKACLILDFEQFRYQKFISDIAGQDIKAHHAEPRRLISVARNWLHALTKRRTIVGGDAIFHRYQKFSEELPYLCDELEILPEQMTYADYSNLVTGWLRSTK